ncbi:hypothetical protein M3Y98_00498500 [Aphelenchoides besseyi]|nr:hypothetical protein M3Y98_00498500 [Aphelenchoides besseyi]KAI6207742.1 hypothetical protein M3Y96_00041000 [Aphelenchoides besseyi]
MPYEFNGLHGWTARFLVGLVILINSVNATTIQDDGGGGLNLTHLESHGRFKRQYYDNDYYGSYYGWQAGRIVGWILGFIVVLLIICVPCICCIGIWSAGWFGLRQAMARRRANQEAHSMGAGVFASNGGVIRRTVTDPPGSSEPQEHRVVYAHASDRYFERRPRTPPPNTAPNTSSEYRRT